MSQGQPAIPAAAHGADNMSVSSQGSAHQPHPPLDTRSESEALPAQSSTQLPGMTIYGSQAGLIPGQSAGPSVGQPGVSPAGQTVDSAASPSPSFVDPVVSTVLQQTSAATASSALAQQRAQEAMAAGVAAVQRTEQLREAAGSVISGVHQGLVDLHTRQDAAAGALSGMRQGMSELHQRQEIAQATASSSEHLSSSAVRRVEEMEATRQADQRMLQAMMADRETDRKRMAEMEQAMQANIQASQRTVAAVQTLQQELASSTAETRRLQAALTESQAHVASLTAQHSFLSHQVHPVDPPADSTSHAYYGTASGRWCSCISITRAPCSSHARSSHAQWASPGRIYG